MLEEDEWPEIAALLREGMRQVKAYRSERGTSLAEVPTGKIFQPALDAYERLTGYRETNHLAIYHYQVSLYGSPCSDCGKPLRTPKATHCAACGNRS